MLAQLLASGPMLSGEFLVFTAIWFFATTLWLWMVWDCLTAQRVAGREKIVWVIVLLATHIVGALLYFVLVRSSRTKPRGP